MSNKLDAQVYKVNFDISIDLVIKICEWYPIFKRNGTQIYLRHASYNYPLVVSLRKSGKQVKLTHYNKLTIHILLDDNQKKGGKVWFNEEPPISFYDDIFEMDFQIGGVLYHDIDALRRKWTIKQIVDDKNQG